MEFSPQLMVTGGYMVPPEIQTGERVGQDKLLRIYSEVREAGFPYQAFQLEPDESGAVMQAQPPAEVLTIKPPLIQVQNVLTEGTVETGGSKAQRIMEIVARVLGVGEIVNLGIRVVYRAPLASNDARGFMLNRVLSFGGEHLDDLRMGGDLWGGIKYVVDHNRGQYTFNVEPSIADGMKSLYLEIDAQFPGSHPVSDVLDRAGDVRDYVNDRVGNYLDKLTEN